MTSNLPTHTDSTPSVAVKATLATLWFLGLVHAGIGGTDPGFVPPAEPHPYPVIGVLVTTATITLEAALLYSLLFRGRPTARSFARRLTVAIGIFLILLIADLMFVSGFTDQPGYRYSNALFVLATLTLLAWVAWLHWRTRTKALTIGPE